MPLLEQRRRLADSERNRVKDMSMLLSPEQAVLLVATVYGIVADSVDDPVTLAAIGRGLEAILSERSVV